MSMQNVSPVPYPTEANERRYRYDQLRRAINELVEAADWWPEDDGGFAVLKLLKAYDAFHHTVADEFDQSDEQAAPRQSILVPPPPTPEEQEAQRERQFERGKRLLYRAVQTLAEAGETPPDMQFAVAEMFADLSDEAPVVQVATYPLGLTNGPQLGTFQRRRYERGHAHGHGHARHAGRPCRRRQPGPGCAPRACHAAEEAVGRDRFVVLAPGWAARLRLRRPAVGGNERIGRLGGRRG